MSLGNTAPDHATAARHAPRRIQRQRTKGWRMPDGAIYVGRPTEWGNPFVAVGSWVTWTAVALGFKGNGEGRRRAAVELYRAWLTDTSPPVRRAPRGTTGAIGFASGREIETGDYVQGMAAGFSTLYAKPELPEKRPSLEPLHGKDLACWCSLDQPCHADVLLELANQEDRC